LTKGRVLSIAGAIGYETEHVEGQFGPETEQSPTLYAQSFFSSPIANRGMFTQHLEAFYDLINRDDFRANWDAGLQMQVTPHISIGPSAQIRYDNHPVSQIQRTDTMVVFGVQFK
jgi:hypothetical protein